jgi:uncharacterized protein (TIGR03000 family)
MVWFAEPEGASHFRVSQWRNDTMFKRCFALVLAVAATAGLLLTPDTSSAQWRGGWGRGFGGYGGGWGYYGGYRSGWGWGYPGYARGWSYPGYGWGWGYPRYYGSYSYPTYYGNYYSPNYSFGTEYSYPSTTYYGSEYSGPRYSDEGSATTRDMKARVDVRVPRSDAVVTINGNDTRQTGTLRLFETPDLPSGKSYKTEFRARWKENGRDREASKTVNLRPGDRITVDLTRPTENEDMTETE